ncbi:hypothetical protein J416_02711 [Gracilibacillus halophilus YIM-C55.5]|uniref:LiaI-LiaF-like transmembrane region domain-containing protein n=1 Tax=Gracilibacillus halophilus YIM-C55.5 TaxID=1308866 RepID=N4WU97_9BACI|nr:DUF5668 domain-containing protein [Gracilibacillus halophilus]ENH97930.1 hypothetical protein J416_02711 [Gracilibacillus halophilus YIM-C55.5]
MNKKNKLMAYLLIGIGIFFLLRELRLPILTDFYSWPTLLIVIGAAFLFYAYSAKDYKNIFPGALLLGLGIHFHSLRYYPFWIDHWGMYTLIVSLAFLLRYTKFKKGLLPGLILLGLSLFALFASSTPEWFDWIYETMNWIERFWPVILIVIGGYILWKR